ncbi:DUF2797 domain-containing protein [Halosquirtibacter laminarini]|uniref:DUF2797 domain-containing protein n=1 Tax=Halosquirtibacter laminarini TaxID=3374600 RepID=A0AC61NMM9_9BACT|nr:DUF2797 domain-containing protein [Prolixibacteraceae bacterium]
MQYKGNLRKMSVKESTPIQYALNLSNETIDLNQCIGQSIKLEFTGVINCIDCGKKTSKSFSQGFCYNCFRNSPMAEPSIINPELSRAQWGEARDLKWAIEHDLIPHYVYLALSSEVKVGVTRHHQVPTRWIDQGATAAAILCETPNRHIAGVIEIVLKNHYTDKTSWMKMLKNDIGSISQLEAELKKAGTYLPKELQRYLVSKHEIRSLEYPVDTYPEKVKSITFDKTPKVEGTLMGIKGQYLIFEHGVFNIRRHSGYQVTLTLA